MADIEQVIASLERLHNRVSTLEAVPHGPISENANDYSDSLGVLEAMIDAEVASGLDAAFKTIDAVDVTSFIK